MVFNNNLLLGASGQTTGQAPFDSTLIGNSAWFNGTDSRMDSPSFSAQSDPTCFTFATWVQLNDFANSQYIWSAERTGNYASIGFDSNNKLFAYSNPAVFTSDMVFRDVGWYHIICSYKGATNTVRMFANGVEITNTTPSTLASPNPEPVAFSHTQRIGAYYVGATGGDLGETSAYLAQTVFLDGFSFQDGDVSVSDFLDTFTFGTNGSQFIPKKDSELATLAGTAGANSYVLDYADSSALGNDISSKNNNFTLTNLSSANQSENTPSNTYATWNPIFGPFAGHAHTATLSEGNLRLASSTSNYSVTTSTLAMPAGSGKFAAKFTVNTLGGIYPVIGVYDMDGDTTNAFTGSSDSVGLRMDGQRYLDGSSASYGSAVSAGNTVEVELDMDNNTVEFLINGSAQGTISKTFTGTVVFMVQDGSNGSAIDVTAEFDYTPDDANFKNLNTANLTAPDYQGIDYFDATLYEGNGTGQRVGDFVPFTDAYTVDNSAMFEHDDARYLSRTIEAPSSSGGKKGTWSVWFKTANIDTDNIFFDNGTTATNRFSLNMDASGQIIFSHKGTTILKTGASSPSRTADFKGDGAWHNLVLKVDTGQATASNRAAMFIDGVEQTDFEEDRRDDTNLPQTGVDSEIGYMDEGATQFVGSYNGSSDNQWDGYLAEVVFLDDEFLDASSFGQLDTATNRWVPKSVSGLTFGNCGFYLEFETAPNLGTLIAQGTGTPIGNMTAGGGLAAAFDGDIENYNAGAQANATSGNIGKDFGSSVTKTITGVVVKMLGNVTIDGGAAAETMTLTVERSANGTDFTTVYTESGISVAAGAIVTRRDGFTNTAAARYARISVSHSGGAETHISELEFYEGGSAGIGTDSSGNGNNFTQGGSWAASDQFIDTPSKNYAVYNTVKGAVYTAMSMSEGNLTTKSGNGSVALAQGFPIQDGYWYYEVNLVEDVSNMVFGLYNPSTTVTASDSNPSLTGIRDTGIVSLIQNNGGSNSIGLSTSDTGLSNPSAGDVVGIYIRKVENTYGMWFSLNGTAMNNTPAANATATADIDFSASIELVPAAHYSNAGTKEAQTNFGQLLQFDGGSTSFDSGSDGNWKHAPVTGFKALNQDNLDDTASKLTAWAWIKNRDAEDNHSLFDRVRGVTKLKNTIAGDNTAPAAESTEPNSVQRFFQRGVQLGSLSAINTANNSYVLWQWLVGDSATTGTVLSNGSDIDATVITADAGHFSVGTYSGTGSSSNFLHGLGGKPEFVAIYCRNVTTQPISTCSEYYSGSDYYMYLSYADGESNSSGTTLWPSDRTATAVPVGTNGTVNASGSTYGFVAFRSIPGVCKVGKYIGNGDSTNNGPYVNVGFKPRWVMVKGLAGSRNWNILDTARNPINIASPSVIMPNLNDTDTAGQVGAFDILADGFKPRDTAANTNASSEKYLYIAMADLGGNGTLPPIYGR
jgi:hypothetical protein